MNAPRGFPPSRARLHTFRLSQRVAVVAIAALGLACDGNEMITDPEAGSGLRSLEPVSGDGQASEIQAELAEPFVVRAVDAQGRPLAGVTIRWGVREGDGRASVKSSVTDEDGLASTLFTLGTEPGVNRVEAQSSKPGTSVTFRAGAFPVAPESAEVYLREDTDPHGGFSRYVLQRDGTFELQRAHLLHRYYALDGTYSRFESELTFQFESADWFASGTFIPGRLEVTYSAAMLLEGYHNESYALIELATEGDPPADKLKTYPPLASKAVYDRASTGRWGRFSRYLFFPSGSFDLQIETEEFGRLSYPGTYSRTGNEVALAFEGWSIAGPWEATGTLEGDRLHVEYNIIMWLSDFDPGTYLLASGEGFQD